jgi:hypothetical protein
MKPKPLPDQDELRALIECNPATGELWWKHRPASMFPSARAASVWNSQHAGRRAFCTLATDGCLYGSLFKRPVKAHRVIWKLVHGTDPDQIDHVNHCRTDNRLCNLRSVTNNENMKNLPRYPTNKSGVTGVFYDRGRNVNNWVVTIGKKWVGCFPTIESAATARQQAEVKHGYHHNHGK